MLVVALLFVIVGVLNALVVLIAQALIQVVLALIVVMVVLQIVILFFVTYVLNVIAVINALAAKLVTHNVIQIIKHNLCIVLHLQRCKY